MLWHVRISLNQSQLDAARVPLQDRVEGSRFTVACGELSPGLFTFVLLACHSCCGRVLCCAFTQVLPSFSLPPPCPCAVVHT